MRPSCIAIIPFCMTGVSQEIMLFPRVYWNMSYGNRRGACDTPPESMSDVSKGVLRRPVMDRMLDVLCKQHRRSILLFVKDGVGEIDVDALIREGDGTGPTEMELSHNHLPKLAEANYIEWDRIAGTISEGSRFDEVGPFLDLLETHADRLPSDCS